MANIEIGGRLHSTATGNVVTGANEVLDDTKNKKQSVINAEVDEAIGDDNTAGTIKGRIKTAEDKLDTLNGDSSTSGSVAKAVADAKTELIGGATSNGNTLKKVEDRTATLETAVGSNGSVDQRIAAAKSEVIGDAASDYNTLGKLEDKIQAEASARQDAITAETNRATTRENQIYDLVHTPEQHYVTVATYADLANIASPSDDTVYRVSSYNGKTSQVDNTVYSEYGYDGTNFVFLCVKNQIDEVYDISAHHSNNTYVDLAAALDGGNNIPQELRRGGMSVKFVQSSDNKYIQFRCMAQNFTTDITQWQGVDSKPTAESHNLPESRGVYDVTNRFVTIDEEKSAASNNVPVPDGLIAECFINHREQSDNSYRLYSIIVNGDKISVRFTKGSGTYIATAELNSKVSIIFRSFHDADDDVDVEIYLILDWSKFSDTITFGYKYCVFSERCYDIKFSPTIQKYLSGFNDRIILSDFEGKFYTFEKVTREDLTLAGNLVLIGYVGGNGAINSNNYSSVYYYPVEKGKLYKVSSSIEWGVNYIAAGFSRTVPANGGTFDEGILKSSEPGESLYLAPDDGFILLLLYNEYFADIYITDDFISETFQRKIDGLQGQIVEINKKIVTFDVVTAPTLLGNAYMLGDSSHPENGGTIRAFINSTLYYYPVEKDKVYKVSSEINGWSQSYGSIGFCRTLPVIGNTYNETILYCWTPSETYYVPKENGYILLGYRSSMKSYLYLPTDLSVTVGQLQEEIDNIRVNVDEYPPLKKKIVCSGSSITWGNGHLDGSMVNYVDKFIKERLSKTIVAENQVVQYSSTPVDISNWLLYGGIGKMISGVNASVEFDLFGDEIAICQAKRRVASDYGIMKVYADGVEIGKFDNKNTIKSETETFSGDAIREVKLAHPCTFNHQIYINGSSTPLSDVIINADSSTMPVSGCNAWVFRGSDGDGSTTCHYIQFAESLGTITSVTVTYNYGRIIAHERSSIGQTDNEYTNEYVYGKGDVSYDPDQPTTGVGSGLEFREIDKRAFFIYKFGEYKTRHFKIEIVGGTNPYFIFNFATNRYNDLMNAGIGGWELADLLNRRDKICHYTQFFKYWHPDILFEEAETNDDWSYPTRRISRSIGEVTLSELQKMHQLEVHKITYNSMTDKYAVEMCTGLISSITPTSLISSDIIGTETQVGDIIRIGNYLSDMHQIVCRKISEVNLETGEVKWLEPLVADDILMIDELDDLIGAEINIRDLSGYKALYKELIEKVHAISPETLIIVVHNGLPNLWTRQLWGYEIVHAELCQEYERVEFINAQEHIYDTMFNTISGVRKETVVSTGASSYNLSFTGISYGGWQGFKVLVNGIDVYGKDAYIEMDMAYRLNTNVSGSNANKISPYDRSKCGWNRTGVALKLYFTQNIPSINDTIEVQYADEIWSNDFCHPTDLGAQIYAESYCDKFNI